MPRLTKKFVDACKADQKEYFVWDDDLPGYGLRVFPSGKKSYLLQYRHSGRTRRIAIGLHGKFTPDSARLKAMTFLGEIAAGGNPSADRKKLQKDITVAALCDSYLQHGCANKKASTLATDQGRIARHIKPLLGHLRVSSVTKSDISRAAKDITNGKTALVLKTGVRGVARVRGGKGTSARTMGLLGAIFQYAVKNELIESNPVRGVERSPDRKLSRFLNLQEVQRLGEVLKSASDLNPHGLAAIKLLLLTGCRRSEILTLKWHQIDWTNKCFVLPDSKTGAKTVPVGSAAIKLLDSLPRQAGSDFVFPSGRGHGGYVGIQKDWAEIRERANLDEVRLHDLRRTFASTLAIQGQSLITIGKLLGHADPSTTAIYAHLTESAVSQAAEVASAKLMERLDGN